MKKIFILVVCVLILVACSRQDNISASNINNALLLKNNEPFVLNEREREEIVSITTAVISENLEACKCIAEAYKNTVENKMGGNAIRIEFKEEIVIEVPPKWEDFSTKKLLIGTNLNDKLIGFEVNGNYRLYKYGNDISEKLNKLLNSY